MTQNVNFPIYIKLWPVHYLACQKNQRMYKVTLIVNQGHVVYRISLLPSGIRISLALRGIGISLSQFLPQCYHWVGLGSLLMRGHWISSPNVIPISLNSWVSRSLFLIVVILHRSPQQPWQAATQQNMALHLLQQPWQVHVGPKYIRRLLGRLVAADLPGKIHCSR